MCVWYRWIDNTTKSIHSHLDVKRVLDLFIGRLILIRHVTTTRRRCHRWQRLNGFALSSHCPITMGVLLVLQLVNCDARRRHCLRVYASYTLSTVGDCTVINLSWSWIIWIYHVIPTSPWKWFYCNVVLEMFRNIWKHNNWCLR